MFDNTLIIHRFGIYHWEDYPFEDGSKKDKYWISLNCSIDEVEYYAILPTSQVDKFYHNIDILKIDINKSKYFDKVTILDFNNIKVNTKQEIEKVFLSNKLTYKGLLEKNIQDDIVSSITNAETLSEKKKKELLCIK